MRCPVMVKAACVHALSDMCKWAVSYSVADSVPKKHIWDFKKPLLFFPIFLFSLFFSYFIFPSQLGPFIVKVAIKRKHSFYPGF